MSFRFGPQSHLLPGQASYRRLCALGQVAPAGRVGKQQTLELEKHAEATAQV